MKLEKLGPVGPEESGLREPVSRFEDEELQQRLESS
jgi:hypothetical protein